MQVIAEDVTDALHAHGVEKVRIATRLSPAWTTDWMSDAGKAALKGYGIAPPVQQVIDISGLRGGVKRHAIQQPDVACPNCGSMHTRSPASSARRRARRCTSASTAASPSITSSATKTMSKFYPLTVAKVKHETRDTIAVTFDVPPELRDSLPVPAGPAPDPARHDRRRRRAPLLLDLLGGAGQPLRVAIKRTPRRPVLDLGQRHASKPGATST
jgi:hypothetical protein